MIEKSISKHLKTSYSKGYPFPHIVIDNFLPDHISSKILDELQKNETWFYDRMTWTHDYQVNKFFIPSQDFPESLDIMKDKLPHTSLILDYLNSQEMLDFLSELTGIPNLISDPAFHGGGVHKINTGGKLAVHLDYNIHPVTKKYRKLNLLLYLNPNWKSEWGGNLEFWSHNSLKNKPEEKIVTVDNIFNRAVLFDTTHNSWHGFATPMTCPEGVYRKSLAVYYLTDPPEGTDPRPRALYAPTKEQETNPEILKFPKTTGESSGTNVLNSTLLATSAKPLSFIFSFTYS
jgi:Rps23 Pro-64 3,4-dihydroxylase Tpa1-like proline 4-hydroxylase